MPKRGSLFSGERSISKISGAGNVHSFSEEEKEAFSEHINMCLGQDPLLARHLPLKSTESTESENMDLFEKSADGLIMCKLINLAQVESLTHSLTSSSSSALILCH
jgi:hypothetical protein